MSREVWALIQTVKHGREIVEFRMNLSEKHGPPHAYTVRVDIARLERVARAAEKNKNGTAKRGPIQIHYRAGAQW